MSVREVQIHFEGCIHTLLPEISDLCDEWPRDHYYSLYFSYYADYGVVASWFREQGWTLKVILCYEYRFDDDGPEGRNESISLVEMMTVLKAV